MATTPVVYTDDPDAAWTFTITSRDDTSINWSSPVVAIGSGTYTVSGTWVTAAGTTRQLSVPLSGLTKGVKRLYLRVPGGTDISLGDIQVRER